MYVGKISKTFCISKEYISLYPISRVQKIHLASINNFSNRKYIRAFNSLTMWHNEKGDQLLVFTSTVSQCQKSFMLVIYRRENRLENLRKVLYDLSCLNGFHKQRSAKITATNVIIDSECQKFAVTTKPLPIMIDTLVIYFIKVIWSATFPIPNKCSLCERMLVENM